MKERMGIVQYVLPRVSNFTADGVSVFCCKKYLCLLTGILPLLLTSCKTTMPEDLHHESAYITQVKHLSSTLQTRGYTHTGLVLAALASEPIEVTNAALRMNRGTREPFREYLVNPTKLTKAQAQKRPVLLLHGDQHNQSAFIPLLAYLYRHQYTNPIFTVNLPSVKDEKVRHEVLDKKLAAIDALYQKEGVMPRLGEPHVRSCIIGHSWGADEAVLLEERDPTERPLILIGALKHSKRPTPQVYINAASDVILNLPSEVMDHVKPVGEVIHIHTGHLGLLSHPEVLNKCYEVLTLPHIRQLT